MGKTLHLNREQGRDFLRTGVPGPAKPKPKRAKFGNRKVMEGDLQFDSVGERSRWRDLCQMQREGAISNLKRQVRIVLLESVKYDGAYSATGPMTYYADYQYIEYGELITEDFKSVATLEDSGFAQKRHMLKALKGIDLRISMSGQVRPYGAPKTPRKSLPQRRECA